MIINTDTRLMGLLGRSLKHSLSPYMHNLTLAEMGLNGIYLPLEVEPPKLREALNALKVLNFVGVNVTIPYKEAVIEYLDDLSEDAKACGAVNLIKNNGGKLTGYNTDGRGFLSSLKETGVVPQGRVLFIGSGGAARAVAYELSINGIKHMDFLDINLDTARGLSSFINKYNRCSTSGWLMNDEAFSSLATEANLIINCSPVGMYPNNEGIPVPSLDMVSSGAVIYDLVYNPYYTRLLKMGQAKGLQTISGLFMLVHQGAITLEILTGRKPPLSYMKEVVSNYYQEVVHE